MKGSKTSREYEDAGGSAMTREEAEQHFADRARKLKLGIKSLPLAEHFRLVADAVEAEAAGATFPAGFTVGLATHAMAELKRRRR